MPDRYRITKTGFRSECAFNALAINERWKISKIVSWQQFADMDLSFCLYLLSRIIIKRQLRISINFKRVYREFQV